jgi:hypothetical protein
MPSREGSKFRPLWRIRRTFNKQKVTHGDQSTKKMLPSDVRSRNVYENKGSVDKMSAEISDIYVDVSPFLQKITDSEGQYAANGAFGACFYGNLRPASADQVLTIPVNGC